MSGGVTDKLICEKLRLSLGDDRDLPSTSLHSILYLRLPLTGLLIYCNLMIQKKKTLFNVCLQDLVHQCFGQNTMPPILLGRPCSLFTVQFSVICIHELL